MAVSPKKVFRKRHIPLTAQEMQLEDYIDTALLRGNFQQIDDDEIAIEMSSSILLKDLYEMIYHLRPKYKFVGWKNISVFSDSIHHWVKLFK